MKRRIGLIVWMLLMQVVIVCGQEGFVETSVQIEGKETVHMYQHTPSGLSLIWVENQDPNRCFALGVRTPVKDHTGVNHIIEHTVFKGSQKFPGYQLFFEASAKYPHSFMNAMTSSDMTYYPFATPYPKCFEALLEVYLDSVLHPLMLEQPYSFYEEAYYKDSETGKEGGVVYNEMKGASTSVERQIFKTIRAAYYEGGNYAYDSGGLPEAIPQLSYDQFKETYRAYYYPGNMCIVLYGDLPIEETLQTIDDALEGYENRPDPITISMSPQKSSQNLIRTYQSPSHKAYILKSFLINQELTQEQQVRLSLWVNTYLQDPVGDFQKSLRDQGLKSIQIMKDEGTVGPIYTIIAGDISLEQLEASSLALDGVVSRLPEIIIPNIAKEQDTLARQQVALLQEADDSDRGLSIATTYLEEWLHHRSPHSYYEQLEAISGMTDMDSKWCQETLIQGLVKTIHLIPETMTPLKPSLSIEQLAQWKGVGKQIETWKNTHSEAGLEPVKSKELVMAVRAACQEDRYKGVTYMKTPVDQALLETHFYYPTHHIQQEQLPYLFLYSMLLEQAAREYSPFEGFVTVRPVAVNEEKGERTYLKISILEVGDKADPLHKLQKMKESLVQKSDSWYQEKLDRWAEQYRDTFAGDVLGTLQSLNESASEGAGRYLFETQYPLYQFVMAHKEDGTQTLRQKLLSIGEEIGLSKGAYVGMIGAEQVVEKTEETIKQWIGENPLKTGEEVTYVFKHYPEYNLYCNKGSVDYLVYSYEERDKIVSGKDYVMAAYSSLYYLQPQIRGVQGAYGSGMSVAMPYRMSLYTYRDPDYRTSMKTIEEMTTKLREQVSEVVLEDAKTEALGNFQRQYGLLGSTSEKGEMLQKLRVLGMKEDYIAKVQRQIVNCTAGQIRERFAALEEMLDASRIGIATQRSKVPRDFKGTIYQ